MNFRAIRRPECCLDFAPADRRLARRSGSAGEPPSGGASGPAGRLEDVKKVLTRTVGNRSALDGWRPPGVTCPDAGHAGCGVPVSDRDLELIASDRARHGHA